jgi:hypothetical protein
MGYLLLAQLQIAEVDELTGSKIVGFLIVGIFLTIMSWLANRRMVNK